MNKLKPCPFCDNEAEIVIIGRPDKNCGGYYIRCKKCCVESSPQFTEKKAIKAWNRRVK